MYMSLPAFVTTIASLPVDTLSKIISKRDPYRAPRFKSNVAVSSPLFVMLLNPTALELIAAPSMPRALPLISPKKGPIVLLVVVRRRMSLKNDGKVTPSPDPISSQRTPPMPVTIRLLPCELYSSMLLVQLPFGTLSWYIISACGIPHKLTLGATSLITSR